MISFYAELNVVVVAAAVAAAAASPTRTIRAQQPVQVPRYASSGTPKRVRSRTAFPVFALVPEHVEFLRKPVTNAPARVKRKDLNLDIPYRGVACAAAKNGFRTDARVWDDPPKKPQPALPRVAEKPKRRKRTLS